jgi:hypothetical protein
VLLQFLHENFVQYQDKIQLFMLDHATRCKQSQSCNCHEVIHTFLGTKARPFDEKKKEKEKEGKESLEIQENCRQ